MNTGKKVLIGMSGGIDSAVAAYLLKEQGYNVEGVYHNYWADECCINADGSTFTNRCCGDQAYQDALDVCKKLDIPLHRVNYIQEFYDTVVQYYLDTYKAGFIPNPCIECNRSIKFGLYFTTMQDMWADYISTGHYANVIQEEQDGEIEYRLKKWFDPMKDQSYFLYTMDQWKLSHCVFPLAHMTKGEVRKIAIEQGLDSVIEKPESMGICFHPDKGHIDFLRRHLGERYFVPGEIRHTETNQLLGQHNGLLAYTIWQRRWIDIWGFPDPVYVSRMNPDTNTLWLGPKETLMKTDMIVRDITWSHEKYNRDWKMISVKIRHRTLEIPAQLTRLKNNTCRIDFERFPNVAITPGQTAVFYDGDYVVGWGQILE